MPPPFAPGDWISPKFGSDILKPGKPYQIKYIIIPYSGRMQNNPNPERLVVLHNTTSKRYPLSLFVRANADLLEQPIRSLIVKDPIEKPQCRIELYNNEQTKAS